MKTIKTIAASLILLLTLSLNAQDLKTTIVPQSFTEGLLKEYPNAKEIEWKKNGTDFKVEFEVNQLDHEIWFNKDGLKVRLEQHVVKTTLPKNIADVIKRDYPGFSIDSVKKTEKDGVITYEVEIEKGWELNQKIGFTLTGKVLSVTKD